MKLKKIKEQALRILKRNHVTRAAIFGSFAKKNANKKSDIDMLVEFSFPVSLIDFLRMKYELEDSLGKRLTWLNIQLLRISFGIQS